MGKCLAEGRTARSGADEEDGEMSSYRKSRLATAGMAILAAFISITSLSSAWAADDRILLFEVYDRPDPVPAGGQITYFGTVVNNTDQWVDIVVTSVISVNVIFVSCDPHPCGPADRRVTWAIGLVGPGSSGWVTLVVEVNPAVADGTIIKNRMTIRDDSGHTITKTQNTIVGPPEGEDQG
jgi:hypothetical protein